MFHDNRSFVRHLSRDRIRTEDRPRWDFLELSCQTKYFFRHALKNEQLKANPYGNCPTHVDRFNSDKEIKSCARRGTIYLVFGNPIEFASIVNRWLRPRYSCTGCFVLSPYHFQLILQRQNNANWTRNNIRRSPAQPSHALCLSITPGTATIQSVRYCFSGNGFASMQAAGFE